MAPGELVSIEGASGRGKTSLLFGIRGIGHEKKEYRGEVFFKGSPLNAAARKCMGLVLQNPHAQMISTLVREELMFGLEEGDAADIREGFQKTVALLGLEPLLDKPVRSLSSGQKHLVAIGAAGMMSFDLLLMDEPFLYLDPGNIGKVLDYIRYLREQGAGVVLTSHPGIVSSREVDRVVRIDASDGVASASLPPMGVDPALVSPGLNAPVQRSLSLHRVGYGYDGMPLLAVELSFTLTGGSELWIEGCNGSGKTTLLRILSGFREPDQGRVVRTGAAGPCRVMTLTQNPDRHFFEPTVQREMAGALMGKQRDRDRLKAAGNEIQTLLSCVGLDRKTRLSPFSLSFGEKIHLAAAQAVLLRPDFIFVDDILGFMDGREREQLLAFLRMAMARTRCGLVFTSSRGRYSRDEGEQVIRLKEYTPGPGPADFSRAGEPLKTAVHGKSITPPRHGKKSRKPGFFKGLFRAFKTPAYGYVAGTSLLHTTSPLVKMSVNMITWFLIYFLGAGDYPLLALLLMLYYLLSGMGLSRFVADSRFFAFQTLVFAAFMPLIRWDWTAAGQGALAGVRVWLFFIPVMAMMRTTTVGQWMSLFSRFLSRDKKLAMGIAFGLLPCITADAGEILQIQGQKGLVPDKKDLLRPGQLFVGLKAVFIPLLILMEDISTLAGLSVKLKGMEE